MSAYNRAARKSANASLNKTVPKYINKRQNNKINSYTNQHMTTKHHAYRQPQASIPIAPITIKPQCEDIDHLGRPNTFINHFSELINHDNHNNHNHDNHNHNNHNHDNDNDNNDNDNLDNEDAGKGLFKIMSANNWLQLAKSTPIPNPLFGELWHEGEICILFSDSNMGKTILAVQIADCISNGVAIKGLKMPSKRQKVLYYDFELSAKQFELRYSEKNAGSNILENHYSFDEGFMRVEIDPEAEPPIESTFEDYLNKALEKSIVETDVKILIIDNITYLKKETERSKDALPLMKYLKALKSKYGLSILALAHTPKRDLSRPITQNDLGGSKMLYNFVDSCFAIGQSSTDKNLRYIKQIKARNTPIIFDTENVIVCQINKLTNFLAFEFSHFAAEREHLKQLTDKDHESRISEAMELKKQGLTNVKIAKQFGVSEGAVRKWIKKVEEN